MISPLSASSTMTRPIPPSIVLITIGSVTGVSIAALFTRGMIPALVLALTMGLLAWKRSRSENMERVQRALGRVVGRAFIVAIPALLVPFLIPADTLAGASWRSARHSACSRCWSRTGRHGTWSALYRPPSKCWRQATSFTLDSLLTPETQNMIAMLEFRMKRKPLIINTSRGEFGDEAELERALEEGLLRAGPESTSRCTSHPPADGPLMRMAKRWNVIVMPHVPGSAMRRSRRSPISSSTYREFRGGERRPISSRAPIEVS